MDTPSTTVKRRSKRNEPIGGNTERSLPRRLSFTESIGSDTSGESYTEETEPATDTICGWIEKAERIEEAEKEDIWRQNELQRLSLVSVSSTEPSQRTREERIREAEENERTEPPVNEEERRVH
jgi:hypothetical protein